MDPNLELEELRTFVAVAERGSLLGAAETLRTSRGRVRRHLDSLELNLGTPLFSRTRDGVELTSEGSLLLDRAKQLLGGARELVRSFQESTSTPDGCIHLGLQVGYPTRVSLVINEYLHLNFAQNQIVNHIAERPVELLPDKVDVVICLGEQAPKVPCVEFEVTQIPERLFARKSFLEKFGTPDNLEQVEKRLLGTWRGPDESGSVLHLRAGGTQEVHPKLVTSDEQYLKLLALRQDGFIYAPLPDTPFDPEMAELKTVWADKIGRNLRGRVLIPETLANAPRYKLLIETLREFMRDRVL